MVYISENLRYDMYSAEQSGNWGSDSPGHAGTSIARTHAASCLLDRQKFLGRIFNFDFFGVITKYFPNKPLSRTWLKCKLPFLTQ